MFRANQLASGQVTATFLLAVGSGRMTKYFKDSWVLLVCLIVMILVSTWQAWRATSKLEAALGWRRSNTVVLTLISGILTVAGGVLLYIMSARALHRHGIKFLKYWNNDAIEAKIASLNETTNLKP